MKILSDPSSLRSQLERLIDSYDSYFIAVAWASYSAEFKLLLKNRKRIRKMVIGTDFYQTNPKALEPFIDSPTVRMMPMGKGTFHPKIYLFCSSDERSWECVIGSPNFTQAAFSSNTEVAVILSPDDGANPNDLKQIKTLINGYWKRAVTINTHAFHDYKLKFDAKSVFLKKLKDDTTIKPPKHGALHTELLNYSWKLFFDKVRADKSFAIRRELLKAVRGYFSSGRSFGKMTLEERQAISGTLAKGHDLVGGAFGAMGGAGVFANLIIHSPKGLSGALDCIPLSGLVEEDHYKRFVQKFIKSFDGKKRVGRVPTASRLLAMKRPDVFVCINGENENLCKDLGVAPSAIHGSFDKYWREIVCPIQLATWWNSSPPSDFIAAEVWESRAAFLDALYY